MDIEQRLALVITDKEVRKLVVDVLKEVLENGHELGGMADYGHGWNDRGTQIKMIVREMIERWKE